VLLLRLGRHLLVALYPMIALLIRLPLRESLFELSMDGIVLGNGGRDGVVE
jgi:hypothetical protein